MLDAWKICRVASVVWRRKRGRFRTLSSVSVKKMEDYDSGNRELKRSRRSTKFSEKMIGNKEILIQNFIISRIRTVKFVIKMSRSYYQWMRHIRPWAVRTKVQCMFGLRMNVLSSNLTFLQTFSLTCMVIKFIHTIFK